MSDIDLLGIPCVGCKYHRVVTLPFSTMNLAGCTHVKIGPLKYAVYYSRGGDCEQRKEMAE